MASRRRRRRSKWKALRRGLIEHRFTAAEGILGVVALVAGLWLLWPSSDSGMIDHRARWEETVRRGEQATTLLPEVRNGIEVAVAEASMAASARTVLEVDASTRVAVSVADRRLAKIAETMPEIGADIRPFPPSESELVVRMPSSPDREGDALADLGLRLGEPDIAVLVPPRIAPSEIVEHAWLRNAAVQPVEDGRPKIAIVIDDLGNNRLNTEALNRLPGPLTLAFLPYANNLQEQTAAARSAGHELLIHMPMEPVTKDWPGPNALLLSLSKEEFRDRLRQSFDRFHGFVGINNHMGSRLTADGGSMAMVMAELRNRDLLFLDSKTTPISVGTTEARRRGVPYAQRDVFLDNVPELGAVLRQLRATEQVARRRGFAIAIGHPNDTTIEALRRWLPDLAARGFSLVPVSTVVALRTCQAEPLLAGCQPLAAPVRADAPTAKADG
jgi:polysaccharide deacetylase 2 family uncharacterized protein YibQ